MAESIETPRPDPTKLTTEQLLREVSTLKEVVFTRIDTLENTVDTANLAHSEILTQTEKMVDHLKGFLENRLAGMDTATKLLQDINDTLPARIDEKITALRAVHEEKFLSIQKQFIERDVRTEQSSKDSKVAVDAALQAAKEAVGKQNEASSTAIGKSETATMKQIDQLGSLLMSQSKNFDDKLADVKDRLSEAASAKQLEDLNSRMNRKEGEGSGHAISTQFNFSAISVVIAIVSILIAAAVLMKHW